MKKFVYLLFSLLATTMVLSSCSQEEEIIGDPRLGDVEAVGYISKDSVSFYFTVEKCTRIYNAITDRWTSAGTELDTVQGLKLRVAQPSENESVTLRELSEYVGLSAKVTIDKDNFWDAVLHPELEYGAIRIKSISRVEADSRSVAICGNSDCLYSAPPVWLFEPKSRSSYQFDGHYEVINVFVHILQTTKGTRPDLTGSKERIRDMVVARLNQDYRNNNTHISFRAIGVEEINYINTTFGIDNAEQCNKAMTLNNHANALNVYVIGAIAANQKVTGKAADIFSNACILRPDAYYSSVLSHEVGHCLGLFHTHRGTAAKWKQYNDNSEKGKVEHVDGSNSTIAGDYITDTPADPCLWPWSKYSGNSTITDDHGDRYNPLLHNIMSYNSYDYTNSFTPMQIQRMHESIYEESKLAKMTSNRYIEIVGNPLGEAGNRHFTEKTRTLTFPAVADDEEVTWTIYQRSGSGYATSHANPVVTTKTGHSITIQHDAQSDSYEIYATTTTPFGAERQAEWKASAGVPSPAVGTINWSAKGGTVTGSIPGESPTLIVFHDLDISFSYTDFGNPVYRSGITYLVYTAGGGVYETSMDVVLSDMECSNGYIEVRPVDSCCGESPSTFRINCELKWDVYSLNVADGQLKIGVKAATSKNATAEKDSAKSNLAIKSIKITTPEGRVLSGRTLDTPQRAMTLSTAGMAKGQYQIEITDVDGKLHKGRFGI